MSARTEARAWTPRDRRQPGVRRDRPVCRRITRKGAHVAPDVEGPPGRTRRWKRRKETVRSIGTRIPGLCACLVPFAVGVSVCLHARAAAAGWNAHARDASCVCDLPAAPRVTVRTFDLSAVVLVSEGAWLRPGHVIGRRLRTPLADVVQDASRVRAHRRRFVTKWKRTGRRRGKTRTRRQGRNDNEEKCRERTSVPSVRNCVRDLAGGARGTSRRRRGSSGVARRLLEGSLLIRPAKYGVSEAQVRQNIVNLYISQGVPRGAP